MSGCWAKAYSSKEPECTEVTNLRAENERVRAEREELFTENGKLANTLGAENLRLRAAIHNMLDALDDNDEIAAYAYAKTALGADEQRVTGEG
jgi:hypothetical protein